MTTEAEDQVNADTALARFFRVLGDPTRVSIVTYLADRPHTVSELTTKLNLAQSKVSNHLACLRWCRVVETERQGRNVTYFLNDERLRDLLKSASELVLDNQDHLSSTNRIGPNWI